VLLLFSDELLVLVLVLVLHEQALTGRAATMSMVDVQVNTYIVVKSAVYCAGLSVVVSVVLCVLGVDLAIVFGILTAVANYVPTVHHHMIPAVSSLQYMMSLLFILKQLPPSTVGGGYRSDAAAAADRGAGPGRRPDPGVGGAGGAAGSARGERQHRSEAAR